jgi:ribulose-phosphate 3-epimerase
MIAPADPYIDEFADAGADIITVHAEVGPHVHRTLQQIKATGKKVGISLVPSTPASELEYIINDVDLVLVMTVNPGFGGQKFIDSQLEKIRQIRQMITNSGNEIELEVDGGVNAETAKQVMEAGADVLVAGSAVFKGNQEEYAANIAALRG